MVTGGIVVEWNASCYTVAPTASHQPTTSPTTAVPSTSAPSSAPSTTFAPTRTPYEYATTGSTYCRLHEPSVCWGNRFHFVEVTAHGPFEGINVGTQRSTPALVDLYFDGDLDLVVGTDAGAFFYFENKGAADGRPVFVAKTGASNPFDRIDVPARYDSSQSFPDLDGDGKLPRRPSRDLLTKTYIRRFRSRRWRRPRRPSIF